MELLRLLEQHPVVFAVGALAGGAIVTGLVSLMTSAVDFLGRFAVGYFFVRKRLNDEFASSVLISYLNRNGRSFGINDEHFDASRQYVKPEEQDMIVYFRKLSKSFRLFLYRGWPIFLLPGDKGYNDERVASSVRFLRWTVNWEELLDKASREYDEKLEAKSAGQKKKFRIVKHTGNGTQHEGEIKAPETFIWADQEPIGWKPEDIGAPAPEDPLNHLSLGPVVQRLVRDVKFWFKHRTWYKERGLSWRRGYNLFGRPGTGKTSIVRALGEELDIPIHVFDLASMDNHDFTTAWQESQQSCPRIVFFEDFDAIFDGRKNRNEDSFLSFDCILNAVDGVQRQDGLLFFISTNHIESIDPALGVPDKDGTSTRPGRIDVVIELPGLDLEGRLKMARRIVCDDLEMAEKLAYEASDDITAAKFQEKCMVAALAKKWAEEDLAA